MDSLSSWIWLIPALPFLAAIIIGIFGAKTLKENSHIPVIAGVAGSAILSLIVLFKVNGDNSSDTLTATIPGYDWITVGNLQSLISAAIDPLSAIMLAMVSVVATFVVIYSKGYMSGDPGFFRFFAYLGMFVASMLMLILSDNFLMLYVFWEAVGLCSYLLIGFYYNKPSAAAAAKKAFVVNRVGDFGFAIGILLIFLNFESINFQEVFAMVPKMAADDPGLMTTIALCLFLGAAGKSAQLPLYVWLPDAMEGPSPVSALIHAATMVTAGVYMTVRCGAIFTASPTAMAVVAVVGGLTAFFAATIAFAQTDIKRILAYSTVSQLGYMFLAVGVGSATAGMYHLYTHAFFKALLFLSAGSVMHAMHHHIDLKVLGGLRKDIPVTHIAFLIGSIALAGLPYTAGFFSKDAILLAALNHHSLSWVGWLAVITAAMTAFYTFRCYMMTFWGPRMVPSDAHDIHESKWMNFSLIFLAIGVFTVAYAGAGKYEGAYGGWFGHFLGQSASVQQYTALVHDDHAYSHGQVALISGVIAVLFVLFAVIMYAKGRGFAEKFTNNPLHTALLNKWYVDELYDFIIVRPLRWSGKFFVGSDNNIINGVIGIVKITPNAFGVAFQMFFQRGIVSSYALSMLLGLAIMVYYAMKSMQ